MLLHTLFRNHPSLTTLALGLALTAHNPAHAQTGPTITKLKAAAGSINIYGSGFGAAAGSVTVAGSVITPASWSDSSIAVPYSINQDGTLVVVVTTQSGGSDKSQISLYPATLGSAAVDRDNTAYINTVSINGAFNQTHIAPGASFTVAFHYATVCTGGSCPIAVQFGFDSGNPGACFFADSLNGAHQISLTAPTAPGIYYILFDRNQNYCQAIWDFGTPPYAQSIGSIIVY